MTKMIEFDLSQPSVAYLLGVVASSTRSTDTWVELPITKGGKSVVSLLRQIQSEGSSVKAVSGGLRVMTGMGATAKRLLGAYPSEGTELSWPTLNEQQAWFFLRGLFDISGKISKVSKPQLKVRLSVPSERLRGAILEFVPSPSYQMEDTVIEWRGASALDLLGQLYPANEEGARTEPARAGRFKRAQGWMSKISGVSPGVGPIGELQVSRIVAGAILPKKERVSDSGYDLTLISVKKRFGQVTLYGTGVVVEVPHGWYFDVVPRSSIIKRGYILANSVGVIDRGYRGEIMVPLIKIDGEAPELELPARIAQLIPRPIVHLGVREKRDLSKSHRGSGGFGSTGN